MNPPSQDTTILPSSERKLLLSKPAVGLLLATALLGLLLAFSTYQNINTERLLTEEFLAKKGEIIARSVEAGTRTSMMHHMGQGNPLSTLVEESSREKDILFLNITNIEGKTIAQTGDFPITPLTGREIDDIFLQKKPVIELIPTDGIFIFTRQFQPIGPYAKKRMRMMSRMPWNADSIGWDKLIISVGLMTDEFDTARKKDIHHALLMAGILFLVGAAGLYFLFLYQGMQVTRLTLADMKLYTKNVIDSMPAGLITLDTSDKIVSCNHKAVEIFAASITEIQNKSFHDIWLSESLDIDRICRESLEKTNSYVSFKGRTVQLKISGSFLHDYRGEAIGTVLILRDVTLLHEMEKQLEWSRRMASLGKMAAGIAHEVRNPLGTLRGFAQYFGSQPGVDKDGKAYADLMVSEVDRLNHTVSGLLQFARPREPQIKPVDLQTLFQKVATLMAADADQKSLRLTIGKDNLPTLLADGDLLLQVLLNLIKNSINATQPGGSIQLSSTSDQSAHYISVKDSGKGMTQEEKEHMFDPFFTTRKSGTGLGLAVSHQIIEQHQGSFEVSSSRGEGTEIVIVLPNKPNSGDENES